MQNDGAASPVPLRAEGKSDGTDSRMTGRSSAWRKWIWRSFVALILLAAIPFALTLLYAVPPTRPASTLMLRDIVLQRPYERQWVPLTEVAPVLVASVTMSEDGQFCSHRGVDLAALNEVVGEFMQGGGLRGASTIPMQSVKNLFLWHGRSVIRKALELPLAILYDAILSKKRIMEIYLNIVEWGPGIYGIEAASRHYFGKPASQLTARQAALLAVTLPNPHERNPAKPGNTLNRLANVIQKRAAQAGSHVACLRTR
jgi:monofunctional biosynthetic peptidoglycan transglycosylase